MSDLTLTKIVSDSKVVVSVEENHIAVKNVNDSQVQLVTETSPLYTILSDKHIATVPAGSGSDVNFVFTQGSAASSWEINHNLGKYCSVTVVDDNGSVVVGDITYNSVNQITLIFTAAFTGKAYLN